MVKKLNLTIQLKVDDNTTVLLSGYIDPKRIVVFNWTSMTYSLQVARLSGDRRQGACAPLKVFFGMTAVVIAGGQSSGTEVWYPVVDLITTVNPTFPPNYGSGGQQMIAVNGNTELIFYEAGFLADGPKGI
jgi:hypothetical protein